MSETHMLWANNLRKDRIRRLTQYLESLKVDRSYEITIKEKRDTRTEAQNDYLWGCVYPTILKQGGEKLAGWTPDDLHEYYLGEHFGWRKFVMKGQTQLKPKRRSSKLNTKEFPEHWEFIHRSAAMMGIYIPDPDPQWFEKGKAA